LLRFIYPVSSMAGSHWYDFLGVFVHFVGPNMASYIVEFIGTFYLVCTIGLTGDPFAIGSILMVMIFMGGHISGGHFNPSVTLGVRLTGRDHITTKKALIYLIMQLFSGFVASLVVYGLNGQTFFPQPACDSTKCVARAFFGELLYSFALVSVMLNTATTKSQSSNSFFGLAIGFTVLAGAYAVGTISGGAFNPAVATGPTIISAIINGTTMKYLWIYWIANPLASLFAAIVFRVTNSSEYRAQAAVAQPSTSTEGYSPIQEE